MNTSCLLLAVAVDRHVFECVRLSVSCNLLASCYAIVESLQLGKLVEAAGRQDHIVVQEVKHAVVHK